MICSQCHRSLNSASQPEGPVFCTVECELLATPLLEEALRDIAEEREYYGRKVRIKKS